jgi:signal transduction histidine kinase
MTGSFKQPQAVLRAILDSPPGIVILALDREYRYLAFNQNHLQTMKTLWGVDIHVGDRILDLIGRDDDREKARLNFDRALAGESFTLREEYGDEGRQRRVFDDTYSPIRDEAGGIIGLTVYLTDITERWRAELELEQYRDRLEELVDKRTGELEAAHAQLLRVQKLESLGVLAGGVAHDFNNLLGVILGRAELAAPTLAADHAARAHLDIVRETALEARTLTRQLVAYTGKGRVTIRAGDVSEIVAGMASILRATVHSAIELTLEAGSGPLVAHVDVTRLRQVILNLVTNASEAIDGPGRVVVRARAIDVDARMLAEACVPSDLPVGRHASIEVEDSGSGIDDDVRTRLFDPFFTTRAAGHGLGLAAVLGIVKSLHGTILLRTAPGSGSTFRVVLPLANDGASPSS